MLARYAILRELGRGATGAVYAARDRETGATVALKRLDPALSAKSGANLAGRFLKHARSARLLKHRNIVAIHEAGDVGGTVYVAMEMLEGRNLRQILDEGPLPVARAIRIARDIASGLAHAHLEGVVHGALKPSNVVVLRSGAVKLTDFGTGQAGPSYLSPEQLRGEPVDHRCDVFSLGAVFYEMLAHRPPFAGGSAKEILENIHRGEPPPPSELNPNVPRALDAIVLAMLAAQPAARMPGAPILLRELKRVEEGLGLEPGANAVTEEPTVSAPAPAPEPRPRTRDPNRLRDRMDPSAEELHPRERITDDEAFDYQKAIAIMERESRRERSPGARPVKYAAFVLAALGIAVAGVVYFSGQWRIAAGRVQEAVASALAASRPTAPEPTVAAPTAAAPVAETKQDPVAEMKREPVAEIKQEPEAAPAAPPKRPAAEPLRPAQTESVVARTPEQAAPAAAAPAHAKPLPKATQAATQAAMKTPELQPGGTARLILAISPRGELYIDGKHQGTTPPVTTFDLEPGMHRVEVRSGSRTPYLTYVMVQAGDVRRIRHDFDTRGAVHPPESASWRASHRPARPDR